MGASNQEMVSNVHLNRMGVTGDGIAYLSKPNTPQEQHRTISAVSTRVQSEHSPIVSSEFVLPAVKETVGVFLFSITNQLLKRDLRSRDYFYANSPIKWQSAAQQTYNSARIDPLPLPHAVCCCIPPRKYFPKFNERLSHVR